MSTAMHVEVAAFVELLAGFGFSCPDLVVEPDNAEYGAAISDAAGVRFRVGKLTPRKVGHFVTVWQRASDGSTQPLPIEHYPAVLAVVVRESENGGVFLFSRDALRTHGIISVNGVGGKRGFRVYAPWSATSSAQARRSQAWQGEYFLSLDSAEGADPVRARRLLAAR